MAKNLIRDRLIAEKDVFIETAMGKGDTWAKKVYSGQCGVLLDDIPKLLAILGLKAVPASLVSVEAEQYNALLALAKLAMASMQKIEGPQLEDE